MATLNYLTTTHFDYGATALLPKELARLGVRRPLIVTDPGVKASGVLDEAIAALPADISRIVFDETPGNPTETAVDAAFERYAADRCDGVVCVGGGSSMDLGKAVALLAGSGGPLARFDPTKGGAKLVQNVAPVVAVPTTAGTGSEVSVGFVIIMNDGRKATFASPRLIPAVAICDPGLTLKLPTTLTAATGMDAITHCIEAILSPVVNPPAEGIGFDGLWRGWAHIRRAVADGGDREARWQMMMASTEGALAFVKGLGAVHAMSHAAGRLQSLRLHHGTLNAVILPTILWFNAPACGEKYARMAAAMGLPPGSDLAQAVAGRNAELGLPPGLAAMGIEEAMIEDLAAHAAIDLSSRSNPVPADAETYKRLFRSAM